MQSRIGQAPKPLWASRINFEVSEPFWIQWIATGFVGFEQLDHIKNPLLHNKAVTFGKDCQEIEGRAGHALCNYLDQRMRAWQADAKVE